MKANVCLKDGEVIKRVFETLEHLEWEIKEYGYTLNDVLSITFY